MIFQIIWHICTLGNFCIWRLIEATEAEVIKVKMDLLVSSNWMAPSNPPWGEPLPVWRGVNLGWSGCPWIKLTLTVDFWLWRSFWRPIKVGPTSNMVLAGSPGSWQSVGLIKWGLPPLGVTQDPEIRQKMTVKSPNLWALSQISESWWFTFLWNAPNGVFGVWGALTYHNMGM